MIISYNYESNINYHISTNILCYKSINTFIKF